MISVLFLILNSVVSPIGKFIYEKKLFLFTLMAAILIDFNSLLIVIPVAASATHHIDVDSAALYSPYGPLRFNWAGNGYHGFDTKLPGRDISRECGAQIYSPIDGYLISGRDGYCGPFGCYNSYVKIENNEWIFWMLHGADMRDYGKIGRGEPVMTENMIGNASGCHIHFSQYDKETGEFVDPYDYFKDIEYNLTGNSGSTQ